MRIKRPRERALEARKREDERKTDGARGIVRCTGKERGYAKRDRAKRGEERRGWQIARQRCLRGREEISKRILLPPSTELRPFGNMAPSGLPATLDSTSFPTFSRQPTRPPLTLNFNAGFSVLRFVIVRNIATAPLWIMRLVVVSNAIFSRLVERCLRSLLRSSQHVQS